MYSGINNYAVSNDLIVLYPQTKWTTDNTWACYDTWGVTGDDYATKGGVQPSAIMKMVDRLIEPRDPDFKYNRKNLLWKW
jgi:hypothetical protein